LEAVSVPCRPINDIDDVFADPHVRASERAEIPVVAFPAGLGQTPATYRTAPPALGADTEAVLGQKLRLDAEPIAALRTKAIV